MVSLGVTFFHVLPENTNISPVVTPDRITSERVAIEPAPLIPLLPFIPGVPFNIPCALALQGST